MYKIFEDLIEMPVTVWSWFIKLDTGLKFAFITLVLTAIPVAVMACNFLLSRKKNKQDLTSDTLAEKLYDKLDQAQQSLQSKDEEIRGLKDAIEGLRDLEEQSETAKLAADAEKQLQEGNTDLAKALFRQVAQNSVKKGKEVAATEFEKAAQAYRRLGALAYLDNTHEALEAYQEAVKLDTQNADGWNSLGHILLRIGELDKAGEAYKRVLSIGESQTDTEIIAVAYGNLGVIRQTQGDLAGAEDFYRKSLKINEELGRKEGMA
ncbi:tetratricopeptide repeat protein, partial [Maridesulfovibrio hydrothermalis]